MKIVLKENHLAATAGLTACRPALTSPEKSAGFPQCIFPRPLGPSKGRGGRVPSVYFSSPLWPLQGSRRQASRVLFLAPLSPSKGRCGSVSQCSVLSVYFSSLPPRSLQGLGGRFLSVYFFSAPWPLQGPWRQGSLSVCVGPPSPGPSKGRTLTMCRLAFSKFQSFKNSKFQSFKVSNFEPAKFSKFQTFKVSKFQSFEL